MRAMAWCCRKRGVEDVAPYGRIATEKAPPKGAKRKERAAIAVMGVGSEVRLRDGVPVSHKKRGMGRAVLCKDTKMRKDG